MGAGVAHPPAEYSPGMPTLDLLLFHAYQLADDPREQELMRPFPPLGLQYLVAWLRQCGFSAVDWFDTTFAGTDSFFERVDATDPRVVGLYGHTVTRPAALQMVRRCRSEGRRVIAGGPDPAVYSKEYLDGGVEVIVIGEGELTLAALMSHLAANAWQWDWETLRTIEGIAFHAPDGSLVKTAPRALIRPLDQLPWPHRDRRDLRHYLDSWRQRHGETALSMTTSRGCPYHCTWCSKAVYGDTFRRRSVEDVVSEVLHLREEWDPDQLWFVDDMFTINKKWVSAFCSEMVTRRASLPFYLIGRPERLDLPLLTALRQAGCFRIYLSAESGAQHVLDAMRKETALEDIYRAVRLCAAAGIEVGLFVMVGYPGERLADLKATLGMLHVVDPAVTLLSVAHPMKGTAFYQEVQKDIVHPAGWEERHGGRLAFKMEYPHLFYEVAQRHIWTETNLVRRWRRRQWDAEMVRLAVKYPFYRAAFEAFGTVGEARRLRRDAASPGGKIP